MPRVTAAGCSRSLARPMAALATAASRRPLAVAARRFCSASRPSAASSSVEVHDDFFSSETQQKILTLMERPMWSFTGGRPPNQFWHMDGLEREPYFRNNLYNAISTKLGRKFNGVERIYANGQTAMQSGAPHIDDGDWTFLYFPNPIWRREWKGSLLFSPPGAQRRTARRPSSGEPRETIAVEYRPNRAVLFPTAGRVHHAEAPSRSFTGLRVSLAFKLRGG